MTATAATASPIAMRREAAGPSAAAAKPGSAIAIQTHADDFASVTAASATIAATVSTGARVSIARIPASAPIVNAAAIGRSG